MLRYELPIDAVKRNLDDQVGRPIPGELLRGETRNFLFELQSCHDDHHPAYRLPSGGRRRIVAAGLSEFLETSCYPPCWSSLCNSQE